MGQGGGGKRILGPLGSGRMGKTGLGVLGSGGLLKPFARAHPLGPGRAHISADPKALGPPSLITPFLPNPANPPMI